MVALNFHSDNDNKGLLNIFLKSTCCNQLLKSSVRVNVQSIQRVDTELGNLSHIYSINTLRLVWIDFVKMSESTVCSSARQTRCTNN